MQVRDVMTAAPEVISPEASVERAAQLMSQLDVGALPVGEQDRLVGMVTDRDIAVRAAAQGRSPQTTRVRDVMSAGAKYCFEDQSIEEVAENMGDLQVRRLPVVNRAKRLVGIVSLGDISRASATSTSGEALREVSEAGGRHSQGRSWRRSGLSSGASSSVGPLVAVAAAAGLAATLMYLLDTTSGPRRRALLRDQLMRQSKHLRRGLSELTEHARSTLGRGSDEPLGPTH